MAKVLIVMCSKDDDDGEMAQMANSIEKFLKNKGDTVTLVDLANLPAQADKLNSYVSHTQLIFTGHSRFFEHATMWGAKNYVCRPLAQRRVGGYTADEISIVVANMVKYAKITDFMFCCCEVASNIDTHEREDGGSRREAADLPSNFFIERYLKGLNGERRVSLLAWIGVLVRKRLNTIPWRGKLTLSGLNGVGYIVEDNPEFLTFSQEYLSKFRTILNRQGKSKTLKKDDTFLSDYVLDASKKKSTHVLSFNISVS
ncbi:hypothetical protein [Archangium lansingense]|uniref:Uncharacterized protein n=1 Tax=Archangium lansingense TaxID=2995310 RepID=A0ABT4AC47_9BACT|nr:hypothetical protein [Archangium lansinium]MCY1079253.1 hypothetical protein [Archangium lansinium]